MINIQQICYCLFAFVVCAFRRINVFLAVLAVAVVRSVLVLVVRARTSCYRDHKRLLGGVVADAVCAVCADVYRADSGHVRNIQKML